MNQKLNEKKLDRNISVFYPDGMRISAKREQLLNESVTRLQAVIHRNIWGIFINPDRTDPDRVHNVSFLFKVPTLMA